MKKSDILELHQGNILEVARNLPSESVHCIVTSPPYWGVRYYTPENNTIWDDPGDCGHNWKTTVEESKIRTGESLAESPASRRGGAKKLKKIPKLKKESFFCSKCGAWKGQLGLEPSMELYIKHIVDVFRELRRVLRKDGTLWLNIGDCYSQSSSARNKIYGNPEFNKNRPSRKKTKLPAKNKPAGLKPKNLCGIPWRIALSLQDDGWILRRDIIWHKPNPIPESVKDRCTTSHEYLFHFSKSLKYFYDSEAIKEPWSLSEQERRLRELSREDLTVENTIKGEGKTGQPEYGKTSHIKNSGERRKAALIGMRNKRSVWTVSSGQTTHAHFAVFPEKLVIPCIMAGTSERGCCSICGKPYKRVVLKGEQDVEWCKAGGANLNRTDYSGYDHKDYDAHMAQTPSKIKQNTLKSMRVKLSEHFEKDCECETEETKPCVVLDPFAGTGTTGRVAMKYGRKFVGVDISGEYIQIMEDQFRIIQGFLI